MSCKWKVLYNRLTTVIDISFFLAQKNRDVLTQPPVVLIPDEKERAVDRPLHHLSQDLTLLFLSKRKRLGAGILNCRCSVQGQLVTQLIVFSPHAGPSGAYSPDGAMGYMMDGQQMMHRPPGDPAFHNQYAHYPAEYYGHHL